MIILGLERNKWADNESNTFTWTTELAINSFRIMDNANQWRVGNLLALNANVYEYKDCRMLSTIRIFAR